MTTSSQNLLPSPATRLLDVQDSITLQLNFKIQQLKEQGTPIINLTLGEADFFPPAITHTAILQALENHDCRYTPVAGLPALRSEIAKTVSAQQNVSWHANNVLVSHGVKQVLYNCCQAFLNPGDEAIVVSPYWVSYPEMIKLAGAKPCFIPLPTAQSPSSFLNQLAGAISKKTKMLFLNSPNNPLGFSLDLVTLEGIGKTIQKSANPHLLIVSDEIYQGLCVDQTQAPGFVQANPNLAHQTLSANGLSKSAAMSGWRIGWGVAHTALITAMTTIQGQSTSGVSNLSQRAALAVLQANYQPTAHNAQSLEKSKFVHSLLMQSARFQKSRYRDIVPSGAFFFFIDVSPHDSVKFSQDLLEHEKIAVVPGGAFGDKDCIRLTYAVDHKVLQDAIPRFVGFWDAYAG
jgi:aspartate aminotransferase